ncbi:MAG: FtsX-like permease family protein [Candidatus Moranbacteria bacterium]|nr:FtsX-like permease family protein [Candidatus Moranbacteria bacterium]NTW45768.1 FtsX-like permease family protein [Candidatus Moranbacteria bacterium]
MKFSDPIKIALRSLRAAKLRFFLTVLGVVIGVAAVILVMSIGASAQALILSQVEKVGSNLVGILPGASEENGPPASAMGIVTTTLKNGDLKALRQKANVPDLVAASGYVSGSAVVESSGESFVTSYQGVSPDAVSIENMEVSEGRFFFLEEEEDLSRVAVLGSTRADELFPNGGALGSTLVIKDIPFRVVGVLAARGSSTFSNPDNLVYVPLATAQKTLLGIDYLNFARAKIDDTSHIDRAMEDIATLLRDRHDLEDGEESDFSVRSTAQALEVLGNVTNVLTYFLTAIASISLLVGGIGIMNSMLIAVNQRIREVGLRKAVGARPRHIMTQFLIESAFIAGLGGAAGVAFGILVAYLASVIIPRLGYEWEFIVPVSSVLIGLAVSLSVGFVFGLFPAWRASRIPPIEALRYE